MRVILTNERQNFLCQQLDRYTLLDSTNTQLMFFLLGKILQTTERKHGEKQTNQVIQTARDITLESLIS